MNYSVRGLEFEFSRTLWKFMILAILSGQNDLYQIIREKYDLKDKWNIFILIQDYPKNLQRDCLFGMRHFLNGYFLLLDIYIKKMEMNKRNRLSEQEIKK